MSTVTGTLYSTQYGEAYTDVPNEKNTPAEKGGRLRRAYGIYTVAAGDNFDASALINMFRLPLGATLVQAYVVATNDAGTFDIGWDAGLNSLETADPNGMFSAVDAESGAINSRDPASTLFLLATGWNKTFADEVNIQVDLSAASTAAGAHSIELEAWYVLD